MPEKKKPNRPRYYRISRTKVAKTIEVPGSDILLDVDAKGRPVGVEVLTPAPRSLPLMSVQLAPGLSYDGPRQAGVDRGAKNEDHVTYHQGGIVTVVHKSGPVVRQRSFSGGELMPDNYVRQDTVRENQGIAVFHGAPGDLVVYLNGRQLALKSYKVTDARGTSVSLALAQPLPQAASRHSRRPAIRKRGAERKRGKR